MPNKYHKLIVRGLLELGEELTRRQKIKTRFEKVFDGNKNPIRIINPEGRQLMGWNYYPDVYYVTKVERKFIFEVIDREGENDIIADYIQAMFSPNSHAVIFIVPKEKEDEVWHIMQTIRSILKEQFNAKGLPYHELWILDRDDVRDVKTAKRKVSEWLKSWYSEHPIKER